MTSSDRRIDLSEIFKDDPEVIDILKKYRQRSAVGSNNDSINNKSWIKKSVSYETQEQSNKSTVGDDTASARKRTQNGSRSSRIKKTDQGSLISTNSKPENNIKLRALNEHDEDILEKKAKDYQTTVIEKKIRKRGRSRIQKVTPGKRILSMIFNIFVYGFCLVLIAGATIFAFSNDTDKSLFGYRFYHVLTISMKPAFDAGDMIFIKLCKPEEIEVGDIITFVPSKNSEAYLTHRVMEIRSDENGKPSQVVTKGDFNNTNDPPISVDAVVGIYQSHIPKIGSVIQFIRENLILMSICIGSTFLLLVFLRSYFAAKKEVEILKP